MNLRAATPKKDSSTYFVFDMNEVVEEAFAGNADRDCHDDT